MLLLLWPDNNDEFSSRPLVRGTNVSPAERAALRAARKERATKVIEQQKNAGVEGATATAEGATSTAAASSSSQTSRQQSPEPGPVLAVHLVSQRRRAYGGAGLGIQRRKQSARPVLPSDWTHGFCVQLHRGNSQAGPQQAPAGLVAGMYATQQVVRLPRNMPTDEASSRHGSVRQR